jgi:molybdate transport system substrate-binding protein
MRSSSFIAIAALLSLSAACSAKDDEVASVKKVDTDMKPEGAAPSGGGEIKVAGASDLVFAMEELGPRFTQEIGTKVVFIPGSSGKLAAQIKQGAPFDVFLSANMAFIESAIGEGSCAADTKALYAYGRVVLWTRDAGPPLPATLAGITDSRYARIAIAQPDHAPYGAAAKAALENLGIWAAVSSRMVYGSNVKDTMQMAETGSAEVALIALALVKKGGGRYLEIPVELHPPIEQGMAVCNAKNEKAARAFVTFMTSKSTRELLATYGFGVPE